MNRVEHAQQAAFQYTLNAIRLLAISSQLRFTRETHFILEIHFFLHNRHKRGFIISDMSHTRS